MDAPQHLPGQGIQLAHAGWFPPPGAHPSLVPYHRFRIRLPDGTEVGHINFRIGHTRHILYCAGHMGYEVLPQHRGHGYAYRACLALAPFIRRVYDEVLVTADPDNAPSLKTIARLGAEPLDRLAVPEDDPTYRGELRYKLRFRWRP